jgi:acetolactate synthase I/III small subunit
MIKRVCPVVLENETMEYTFNLKIFNQQGVIARVCLLMERRGFSVSYISIEPCAETDLSIMRLRVLGDFLKRNQIILQLNKLVNVIEVQEEIKEIDISHEKIIMSYN